MAWNDEITEAAYTSPGGKRMVFNYEPSMERKTALKTAENTFPDVDGAEIQSLGLGGKKFPMTAIFSGADCFKLANDFENLLFERGYGILEHPIYGKHNVVPTGEIGRSDNLVSSLNESRVSVNFSETITDRAFPESDVAAEDALSSAVDGYEEAAAAAFAELIETASVEDELQLQSVLKAQSDSLFKGVSDICTGAGEKAAALQQKLQTFKNNVTGWVNKVDQLSDNALNIATVLIKTARLPSEIAISALAKIEGYSAIINDMLKNVKKDPVGIKAIKNQYAATSTMLGALVASMGFGVAKTASDANSGFLSRSSVLSAAGAVEEQFEVYKEYVDSQIEKNAFVDTGEGYSALLETIVSAVQVLETVSFDLPVTRMVKLGRDRQLLELLCELYGESGFDRLDQFITDNELTADEIVLLPMGREVRYYG